MIKAHDNVIFQHLTASRTVFKRLSVQFDVWAQKRNAKKMREGH